MRFLSDYSIGELSLRSLGSNEAWIEFAEAKGEIIIPTSKEIRLCVSATAVFDPIIFSELEPDTLSVFEWVSTGSVTDDAIRHIQHLVGLHGVALWETNISDEGLWNLRHLSRLRWLDVGDTNITDKGLAYLRELDELEELTLLNDQITDKGLAHLTKLPKLKSLDLMQTLVTDEGAEHLCRLTSLTNLRIFKTRMTETGYKELRRGLPECKTQFYHPHRI